MTDTTARIPTDAIILSLAYDCSALPETCTDATLLVFARAVLAKWGAPVPASHPVAAPSGEGEYLELPGPWRIGAGGVAAEVYSASQMRAYVDADRAARKPIEDGVLHALYAEVMTGHYADGLHYWRGTPAHRFARAIEHHHGITAAQKGGQHGTE